MLDIEEEKQKPEAKPVEEPTEPPAEPITDTQKGAIIGASKVIEDKNIGSIPAPEKKPKKKKSDWKKAAEEEAKPFNFGTVVALFNKTKPIENGKSAFCPHFMQLKHANGCWYDCQWCYLLSTFGRWLDGNNFTDPRRQTIKDGRYVPTIKPKEEVEKYLTKALETLDGPMLFNSGELSDSLVDKSMMLNTIMPIFNKFQDKGHKLLILTKSADYEIYRAAVRHNAQKFTIVSHSINSNYVADLWEKDCPDPVQRLAASRAAADVGYETRIRLDPMVPEGQWRIGYRKIITEIMRINPKITVVTLGTPRGLPGTLKIGEKLKKDMSWARHLTENSSWGKKIATEKRLEMYGFAIKEFRRLGYEGEISLCKETIDVWDALRENGVIDYYPGQVLCNCVMAPLGIPEHYKPRSCDNCGTENSVPPDGHKQCRRCRIMFCEKCDDYHDIDDECPKEE